MEIFAVMCEHCFKEMVKHCRKSRRADSLVQGLQTTRVNALYRIWYCGTLKILDVGRDTRRIRKMLFTVFSVPFLENKEKKLKCALTKSIFFIIASLSSRSISAKKYVFLI